MSVRLETCSGKPASAEAYKSVDGYVAALPPTKNSTTGSRIIFGFQMRCVPSRTVTAV